MSSLERKGDDAHLPEIDQDHLLGGKREGGAAPVRIMREEGGEKKGDIPCLLLTKDAKLDCNHAVDPKKKKKGKEGQHGDHRRRGEKRKERKTTDLSLPV